MYKKVVKFSFTKPKIVWALVSSIRIWYLAYPTDRSFVMETFLLAKGCFQHISAISNLTSFNRPNFSGNDAHKQIQKRQEIGVWPISMSFMYNNF